MDDDVSLQDPAAARLAIRSGQLRGFTNHLAPGFVQGNLMIVPAAHAEAFAAFALSNPAALPVLARSAPGDPRVPALGADLDIRTDVGGYMVFRDGVLSETRRDITALWRDDFVTFVLGCSFSFEPVLLAAGVRLRHLEERNVSAMYVTNRPTVQVDRFGGPLVVSMRALAPADAITATLLSAGYPEFHGAPVHIGWPEQIGVEDLAMSYGGHGLTKLLPGELPVFWACGATAQLAALQACLPICITHYKAHMVLTDLKVRAPGVLTS